MTAQSVGPSGVCFVFPRAARDVGKEDRNCWLTERSRTISSCRDEGFRKHKVAASRSFDFYRLSTSEWERWADAAIYRDDVSQVFVCQCLTVCATVPRECYGRCCCDAAPEAEPPQRGVECR